MTGSDKIVSMIYIKTNILIPNSYAFVLGCSYENQKQNLKGIIEEFEYFKDDFGRVNLCVRKYREEYQCGNMR